MQNAVGSSPTCVHHIVKLGWRNTGSNQLSPPVYPPVITGGTKYTAETIGARCSGSISGLKGTDTVKDHVAEQAILRKPIHQDAQR